MRYNVSVLYKADDSGFDPMMETVKRKSKPTEPKLVHLTTIDADYYEFVEPRPGKAFLRSGSPAINFFTTTPGDHFWNKDWEVLVARLPEGDWVIEAVVG